MNRRLWRSVCNLSLALLVVVVIHGGMPSWIAIGGPNSIALWEELVQWPRQIAQAQPTVDALMQQGKLHYENEQFLAAAQALQSAIDIYTRTGDRLRQAQALGLQALAWQKLSQLDRAQTAIDQSLELLARIPNTEPEISHIRAQVLNAQGHLQLALGQADQALESWTAAETNYRQAQFDSGVLGAQINQAQALQSLGFYRRVEKRLDQLESSLLAEPSQLESSLRAKGLLTLGNVLQLSGEVERSHDILMTGLAIAQADQLTEDGSQALLALGNVEQVLAKRAEAIQDEVARAEHIRVALEHYQHAHTMTSVAMTRVLAKLNQMSLLIETNKTAPAQVMRAQLLEAIPQLPSSRASIYASINLAQHSMALSLSEEAPVIAQNLANAVEQARLLADKRAEAYALLTLGKLYEQVADTASARQTLETALTTAQAIRADDIVYQCQWQIGRLLRSEQQARKRNQPSARSEAITYYTAAVATLNVLRSDLVVLNPDLQFSFRDSVEPVYRELVDLLLSEQTPSIKDLKQARDVIESLQMAEIDNFFRDTCAQPEIVNIDNIDPTAAVIYPILLPERLAVILKLPGVNNLRYYSTHEASKAQIDAAVKHLLGNLKRRSTPPGELQLETQRLYHWLLEPFTTDLEQQLDRSQSAIKTLVFVLDGSLRNVPMASLYDGTSYLIERYAIAVLPGLTLLAPKTLQEQTKQLLLAGATAAPSFTEAGLGSLEHVAFEMATIEAEIAQTTVLENQDFQKQIIREKIKSSEFNVVHLATHANFSSNPDKTFLLAWDERISANDIDTLFQVSDPSQQKSVDLLVLSACETAAGDDRAALGLAGVAIRADVQSTLATLWQVNDASTAEFMLQFYQQLDSGQLTKAEALRNAQLAFLKDYPNIDYNRPFHWAAFTLVGNWL